MQKQDTLPQKNVLSLMILGHMSYLTVETVNTIT